MKCTKTFLSILLTTLSFSLQGQDFEQLILGAWQEEKVTFSLICEGKTYDNFIPEWNYAGRVSGGFTYFFRANSLLELDSAFGELRSLSSGTYRIVGGRLFRSVEGIELQETIRRVDSQWLVTKERETEILTASDIEDMREMRKEGDFPPRPYGSSNALSGRRSSRSEM